MRRGRDTARNWSGGCHATSASGSGAGSADETSFRCGHSIWPTVGFRRLRLHNPKCHREPRKCRQRLHYSSRSRLRRWAGLSPCHGRTTSACSRCGTRRPSTSTRPRRFAADGVSASSTGRSTASSTSVRRCRGTRRRCSATERNGNRRTWSLLLELGGDFTFVGRQRRLRVGDEWYRIDLLVFHRRLRCLVVIDLKLGKFTHADAGLA